MAKIQVPYIDRKGNTKVLDVNDTATRVEFTNKSIASIDLKPLSACLRLKDLHLYSNWITTLDLTPLNRCTMLQTLVLRDNQITSLDFTPLAEHINLSRIDLRKNQIQTLNVDSLANHANLEKFTIHGNPLLELDISALITCRGLKEVTIDKHTKLKADKSLMAEIRGPLRRYKSQVIWIERQVAQQMARPQQTSVAATLEDSVVSTVLGLLKSVPRISMEQLSEYSQVSIDETRELVFVLVGKGEVEGRYDPDTDDFISLSAVQTAQELRSEGPVIHKCKHCGSPLPRTLISGERFTCQSCGMMNEG